MFTQQLWRCVFTNFEDQCASRRLYAESQKVQAEMLHNRLQNGLVNYFRSKFGEDNVGSEQKTGFGTSIDVVVKENGEYWFYEIKTAKKIKTSVRQAIPQLLEYA